MKIINFSSIFKYRIYIIMSLAVIVGIMLISIAIFKVFVPSLEERNYLNSIFNLKSYYAKCNVKVNSNKTTNIHTIEEWYINENNIEKFRFNYKDFMQNDYSIIVNENKIKVENISQVSRYITTSEDINKENLYSLATYINLINDNCFKTEVEVTEVTTKYNIYIKEKIDETKAKKYTSIMENSLNIDKIEVNLIANKPTSIKIFSSNKTCIEIEFLDFVQNLEIDLSIFEV